MSRFRNNLFSIIDKIAFKADLARRAQKANHRACFRNSVPLTSREKAAVKAIWGKYGGDYAAYAFYKKFSGVFDPHLVPDDYYDLAEHVFNLRWAAYFMQHKCHLKYFIPKQYRATVILQIIDGHIVLEDNTEITKEEAVRILSGHPQFIVKKARGTGGGKGVRRIVLSDLKDRNAFMEELFSSMDVEIEDIIQQSDFMAQFNPDSVNTIRLVTLNINEKCTVLSSFLRMGGKGSFVDNLSGGHGVLVGLDSNGVLNEFGVDHMFNKKYQSPSGVPLKGLRVPEFSSISQQIIDFHKKIPFANLIGWDVCISRDGTPFVIEVNLDSAVLEAHQVFNGPIFGERIDEVRTYMDKRIPLLKHQMMTY